MRILEIPQRSDEWFSFREGKISGSKAKEYGTPRTVLKAEWLEYVKSFNIEIPKNAKGVEKNLTIQELKNLLTPEQVAVKECEVELGDAIYKLIAERIAKPINENDYADQLEGRRFSAALRGEILEDEARAKIAERLGVEVREAGIWQADFNDNIICSPDGEIIGKDGKIREAVEIKCLDSWKIVKAFYEQKPPAEYEPQILQYFLVNEDLETLHFALYSDVFGLAADKLELQIFEIKREQIADKLQAARYFQESALALVEEEITKLLF